MKIEEIYFLAKQKMEQLGIRKYKLVPRFFNVTANTTISVKAYSEYWFLKKNVYGVTVKSHTGYSGLEVPHVDETVHEHNGPIEIKNNTNKAQRVDFVQVLPIK